MAVKVVNLRKAAYDVYIGPRPSTDDGDCSSMCDIYRTVSGRAVWVGQMVYSDAIARIQRHKEWFTCRDDLIPF